MNTTSLRRASTRLDRAYQISKHRANFARQAVRLEFRARDARAIDYAGFRDRLPHERPRHIGEVAAKVTNDTGRKALRHWLNQAGRADTDDERQAALKIASEIARLAGLDADQIGREAA